MFSSFVGVCFAVKYKSKENVCSLTGKSLTKFWKTVYRKIFRKPFSFQNTRMLYPALFSFSLPLLTFSASALCPTLPSHPESAFPRTTPPPRAGPGALCLCSFSAPSLCCPRSGPDEAVGELVVKGGAVGL